MFDPELWGLAPGLPSFLLGILLGVAFGILALLLA